MVLRSAVTIILLIFISCTQSVPPHNASKFIYEDIKNVAIIPFIYEKNEIQRDLPQNFLIGFNQRLYDHLKTNLTAIEVIDIQKSYDIIRILENESQYNKIEYITKFSEHIGCEAILTGVITGYSERVGGDYGAEYPASFSFITKLHEGKKGSVLWQHFFYEKQKPLLENVREVGKFFQRKGKWITVEELSIEGIYEITEELKLYFGVK